MAERDISVNDPAGGGDDTPPISPAKKTRHINIDAFNLNKTWVINDENDLDEYIERIRKKILDELDENTVIRIHF
jgi:hypothetical protein